jgi:hypothetical protein
MSRGGSVSGARCRAARPEPCNSNNNICLHWLQEAKRLHKEESVPYGEMAVLFRAFNCNGGKAHSHLQVPSTHCWHVDTHACAVAALLDAGQN